MSAPQAYRRAHVLGTGSYSLVHQAVEVNSGRIVALKKSRVSQRVKRTVLRYECMVLQLLRGHPAITAIYGYGHLPHFEYLAMELLGPSIRDCATGPVAVATVARIVLQMDMLSSLTDASKIVLIDFSISSRIMPGPPNKYDPLKGLTYVVGTPDWASLNAHDGIAACLTLVYKRRLGSLKIIDLGPRDDLESLAYTTFFLLRGDLPWITSDFRREPMKNSMRRIHASKTAASGDKLGAGFPAEFGHLLDYSRRLEYSQLPEYAELESRFTDLNTRLGGKDAEAPLDWSPVEISISEEHTNLEITHSEDEAESDQESDGENREEIYADSYFGWDISDWDMRYPRDPSLTLPIEQAELADGSIAQIIEVTE